MILAVEVIGAKPGKLVKSFQPIKRAWIAESEIALPPSAHGILIYNHARRNKMKAKLIVDPAFVG